MTVTQQIPQKKYPYLAVWAGEYQFLDLKSILDVKQEDVVLISMVEVEDSDKQPYVQWVTGGKESYFTLHEDEYIPLPFGYSLTLCQ